MRFELKRWIVRLMHLLTWPFALPSMAAYRLAGSERVFQSCAMLLSLVPGRPGQYLRASFYLQTLKESSPDLAVGFASWFAHPAATVGRGVVIGSFSIVGTAMLADHVIIASRVSILSGKYQHGGPFQAANAAAAQPPTYEAVRIGRGSWLGEGSIVMADVGEGCIVSAGSVVTKPMPSRSTAVGNPARFIKMEGQEQWQQARS